MNSQFINVITEATPINEKYFYMESQGLWFIISLLSREELSDRIMFEAKIEDILWRQGRYGIGDTFSFGVSNKGGYGTWKLNILDKGLNLFLKDYGGLDKLQAEYPDLDLGAHAGIISLIKKLKKEKWDEKMRRRRKR